MINLSQHSLLTLAESSKLFPHRPSRATLWRWINEGIRGDRLETIVVGGRRLTSREAVADFVSRTTASADGKFGIPPRTLNDRQQAAEVASLECERDGF